MLLLMNSCKGTHWYNRPSSISLVCLQDGTLHVVHTFEEFWPDYTDKLQIWLFLQKGVQPQADITDPRLSWAVTLARSLTCANSKPADQTVQSLCHFVIRLKTSSWEVLRVQVAPDEPHVVLLRTQTCGGWKVLGLYCIYKKLSQALWDSLLNVFALLCLVADLCSLSAPSLLLFACHRLSPICVCGETRCT